MLDPIEREWRRLARRFAKNGASATSEYASNLIRTKKYPIYYGTRLVELFMRRGEYAAAGGVLKEMMAIGQPHPLVDELYSSWLWCTDRRKQAILFMEQKAKFWCRSYLYDQLGAFYTLSNEPEKANESFRIAAIEADKEEQIREKGNNP